LIDVKKVEEFLLKNPELLLGMALVSLAVLEKHGKAPAWTKDLPPLWERLAGPWRGPGSFGKGFGPQVRHK
jgi:hypothetical protein